MKFLIQWSSAPETRHEAYKGFARMSTAEDAADHAGVTLIGRWHDVVAGGGVAICESGDVSAVQAWALNWNGVLEVDVTPVADDEECRSMLRKKWNL